MINETIMIETARANAYVPSLIFNWALQMILLVALTLSMKSKNADMGKWWNVFMILVISTGIVLTFSVLAPEWVNSSVAWFKDLI